MIVLDTNIISEAIKPTGDPKVKAWLDSQVLDTLYLPSIVIAEIFYGINCLAHGKRKQILSDQITNIILPMFEGRILDFDLAAAVEFGKLKSETRQKGIAIADADAFIASIALSHEMMVATHDEAFHKLPGVKAIDPLAG